jgi:hypothetical protein
MLMSDSDMQNTSNQFEYIGYGPLNQQDPEANIRNDFGNNIPEIFPEVRATDYGVVVLNPAWNTASPQRRQQQMTTWEKQHHQTRSLVGTGAVDEMVGMFETEEENSPAVVVIYRHARPATKVDTVRPEMINEMGLQPCYQALLLFADMWLHGFHVDAALLINDTDVRGVVSHDRLVDVRAKTPNQANKQKLNSLASNMRQLKRPNRGGTPPPGEIRAFADDLDSLYESHLKDMVRNHVFEAVVDRVRQLVPIQQVVNDAVKNNTVREVADILLKNNAKSNAKSNSNNNKTLDNETLRKILLDSEDREEVVERLQSKGGLSPSQANKVLNDLERDILGIRRDRKAPSWMEMMFGRRGANRMLNRRSPSRGRGARMRKITFENMNQWRLRRH